jgi:hypothetical protein
MNGGGSHSAAAQGASNTLHSPFYGAWTTCKVFDPSALLLSLLALGTKELREQRVGGYSFSLSGSRGRASHH